MDFRPLATLEREKLVAALRGNVERGDTITMDSRDTTFTGSVGPDEEPTDEEVVTAIKSVPCHY